MSEGNGEGTSPEAASAIANFQSAAAIATDMSTAAHAGGFPAAETAAAEIASAEGMLQAFAFVIPDKDLERVAGVLTRLPDVDRATWFAWFTSVWEAGYRQGNEHGKAGSNIFGD